MVSPSKRSFPRYEEQKILVRMTSRNCNAGPIRVCTPGNLVHISPIEHNKHNKQTTMDKLGGLCSQNNTLISKLSASNLRRFQSSKIKIAHLNIRSLKNRDHLLQLRILIQEKGYDIFTVSESWLNSTVSNAEVEIEGYKLTRLDRTGKLGGGVCVYTRSLLKTQILKELTEISSSGFHQLWMQVQHKNLKSILLCTAYRPPDCPVACFNNDFSEKYSAALTRGKDVFVVGDLNCDMLKNSQETSALKDLCSSLNLTQLITSPTRVTKQSSTLLDVILASNTNIVSESEVIENHISDHYVICTVLNLKLPKRKPTFVITRSYRDYNPVMFLEDLAKVQWGHNSLIDDVNGKLNHFNSNFLSVLESHAPIKTIKIRHRHCPFVDDEVKEAMKKRNRLHKLARQTNNITDWENFRLSRGEVKTRLREAEGKYVQNEIYNNKSPNAMWKVVRKCVPRNGTSKPVYTKDMKELAEEFNAFYTSVGLKAMEESQKIAVRHNLPRVPFDDSNHFNDLDEFCFYPVSSYEIRKIVNSFPSNKAPGIDKVSFRVIKDALPVILSTLTEIVNCSLLTSVYPSAWKISEVTPLLKEGDFEKPNDNRPVSLLPVASKICERVALNQLTEYLSRKKRLTVHQSGNRKRHSTETLNIFLTDTILDAMDKKELTAVVLLDLSKAFDSINHLLLLNKLRSMGVSNETIAWFKSYLSERKQSVRIGHKLSDTRSVKHGVPQGSILGPLLFNIYINDLSTVPDKCPLESYVDDSKVYLSFPIINIGLAEAQLTNDLRNIAAWCCSNSLLVNPEKTKLLLFGTPQMLKGVQDFCVTFLDKQLQPVSFANDLGMELDGCLSYDEHITKLVSKCLNSLCQINRIKHILDDHTLVMVINALVFSRLYYSSSVWANTSSKNVAKLQRVQNFAARIVTGKSKFDHVTPALRQLNWLPVSYMLRYKDAIMTFKCLKGLTPLYLSSRFSYRSETHDRNTRRKDELDVPFYRTAVGQRSFLYRGTKLWNNLSEDIKEASSLEIFKNLMKQFLYKEWSD